MKFTLKNGEVVEIREVLPTDKPKDFRDFIGKIVRERPQPFIVTDRVPSMKEEAVWLKGNRGKIRKKEMVKLVAWRGSEIIGVCDASRQRGVERENAMIGISIAKLYREQGLGKKLLMEIIKLARKKLKPRIIYLTVFEGNKPARRLYEKVGFREVASLPKWSKARGKYWNHIYMRLK